MAKLLRVVKTNDRFRSESFTFRMPLAGTLVSGDVIAMSMTSPEFSYGGHQWTLSMGRRGRHLGAWLTLKAASQGLRCLVDFTLTALNSLHFSRNETFVARRCQFDVEHPTHGNATLLDASDITAQSAGFLNERSEILMSVEIGNRSTIFEQNIQVPIEFRSGNSNQQPALLETNYFTFGSFDWSFSVRSPEDPDERQADPAPRSNKDNFMLASLTRQTCFDHFCHVIYNFNLFCGKNCVVSVDGADQELNLSGHGRPIIVQHDLRKLLAYAAGGSRNSGTSQQLTLSLQLVSVVAFSRVSLCPLNPARNSVNLYDRDLQAWRLEASSTNGRFLKFRLFYIDARHVPRRFMRYVCWDVITCPASRDRSRSCRPINAREAVPFYANHFTQSDVEEEGFEINSHIPVQELKERSGDWLSGSDGELMIEIQWLDSHLLNHEAYHELDLITAQHNLQMRQELATLQAENYDLEKELHGYQQNLSRSTVTPQPYQQNQPQQQQLQQLLQTPLSNNSINHAK